MARFFAFVSPYMHRLVDYRNQIWDVIVVYEDFEPSGRNQFLEQSRITGL